MGETQSNPYLATKALKIKKRGTAVPAVNCTGGTPVPP